ncbi:MAG: DUF1161 domain-containing protein [Candidatus Electrothrix sp. ATG2]|nr:DUF1161 domain-containing protein [Candidatus Electrothrix sp. ATG2]
MRWFIMLALVLLNFSQAYAAIKPCEELKTEIAAKIDAAGVASYKLMVVKNEEIEIGTAPHGEIVGSCEGGTKKIIYTRGWVSSKSISANDLLMD